MKANVLEAPDKPMVWKEVETPVAGPGEVIVKIKAAALNRRDYWISIGKYASLQYPSILGSDGAGVVVELGEGVENEWLKYTQNPRLFQGPFDGSSLGFSNFVI